MYSYSASCPIEWTYSVAVWVFILDRFPCLIHFVSFCIVCDFVLLSFCVRFVSESCNKINKIKNKKYRFLHSNCLLGTTGSNVNRANVSRVLAGSSPSTSLVGSSSLKSSCLSGDLRAWTAKAISAATCKDSDSIYRRVGISVWRNRRFNNNCLLS